MKLIKELNFENVYEITDKLCLVKSKSIKTKFNKPIYMGAVILETSKLHMYQFWYDDLKNKYNDKVELIYTDTDSFIIEVETNDIYNDMYENKNQYDFSEYPKNQPNFDMSNKKVLGKFKDELNSKIITEFIALKPKVYSFEFIDNTLTKNESKCKGIKNESKCKGIKKLVDLKHDEYKQSLFNEEIIFKEFYNLQLNKQNIYI